MSSVEVVRDAQEAAAALRGKAGWPG